MPATATMQIDGGRHEGALAHFAAKPGRSGWTVGRLSALRELAHSFRGDLTEVAAALGRDRSDCDIALNALLGRTPTQALQALNAVGASSRPAA